MAAYDPALLAAYIEKMKQEGKTPSFTNYGNPGPDTFMIQDQGTPDANAEVVSQTKADTLPSPDSFTSSIEAEKAILAIKHKMEADIVKKQQELRDSSGLSRLESLQGILSNYISSGIGDSFKGQFDTNQKLIDIKNREIANTLAVDAKGQLTGTASAAFLPQQQYLENLQAVANRLKTVEQGDLEISRGIQRVKAATNLELGLTNTQEAVARSMFPMSDTDWETRKYAANSPLKDPNVLNLIQRVSSGEKPDITSAIISGDPNSTEALINYYSTKDGEAVGRMELVKQWQKEADTAAAMAKLEIQKIGVNKPSKVQQQYQVAGTQDKANILAQAQQEARILAVEKSKQTFRDTYINKNFSNLVSSASFTSDEQPIAEQIIPAISRELAGGATLQQAVSRVNNLYRRTSILKQLAPENVQGIDPYNTAMNTSRAQMQVMKDMMTSEATNALNIPTMSNISSGVEYYNVLAKVSESIVNNFNSANKGFVTLTPDNPALQALKAAGIVALFTNR